MKPLAIIFDIDGVLADFVLGFTSRAIDKYGVAPRTSNDVSSWSFDDFMAPEQVKALFKEIEHSPSFWRTLPLAPNLTVETLGRINRLDRIHRVYFVTSRIESGDTLQQTREWLRFYFVDHPNVIMSNRKAEIAKAVSADYSIEDKWDNAQCIHWFSDKPQTKSYLINRPYNQVSFDVGAKRVRRVVTVDEFLNDIEERK